uniref:Uncharacterized protein n=1 Tax=Astyanax mexicanus TaxID=7994 RepID=W5KMN4_ASTMX
TGVLLFSLGFEFAAAPLVLATVGFTTAGITAGSTAAAMMSSAAVANGGGIAVGSLVAMLQSAGGLFSAASAGGIIGGVAGWLAGLCRP